MAETVLETLVIKTTFDTSDAKKGLSDLKKELSKFKGKLDDGSSGGKRLFESLSKVTAITNKATRGFRKVSSVLGSWFKESNDYVEAVNLFNVAMGKGAKAAEEYANGLEAIMGIDLKEWFEYQGGFNQLMEGYGIASQPANVMSKNLTQLAYDLSSLWNVEVSEAFHKLQSGMSGQIKGLKVWGINVSVAQLKEVALAHGIDLATSKMTEAQKATLRYIAIMEQTTNAQGDLARTIATPSNALRILNAQWTQGKRVMGQVVSVIAVEVIPWFQALVQIIKEAAQSLANSLGYELPEIDYSDVSIDTSSFEDIADSLDEATDNAKKLKKYLLGIDELNVMTDKSSSATEEMGGGYAYDFGLDLGKYDYDFLSNIKMPDLEPYKEKLKEVLLLVGEIGFGFLAWKLSSMFLGEISALTIGLGAILLIDSIHGVLKDGLDIGDIVKGTIGGALVGAGVGFKFGGWKGAIGGVVIGIGVSLLMTGITSGLSEGWNAKNIITTVSGALATVTGVAGVLGIFSKLKGMSKISGAADAISEISTATETVSTSTSTLTSKLTTLVKNLGLGIAIIAEVAVAAGIIVGAIWGLGLLLEQVGNAWQPVLDNGITVMTAVIIGTALLATIGGITAALGTTGTTLIVNIALGTAILAELGVATGLFVAEIWAIGWGLDQIGIAWKPVLTNGKDIAVAIGIGTGVLIAIGAVAALLGIAATATGGLLPLAIAAGTLMLIELGAAALLFIAEIWAIGKGLDEVGKAWQPVLDNGDTISKGIEKGTELLIAVGAVTALMGTASIASVGLLPVAIGLGTALLVDLGKAAVDFNDSLVNVANSFSNKLQPALRQLNGELPSLSDDMEDFTGFIKFFAGQVVDYSKSSAISGFASTVDSIIKFFTKDPIKSMADDVNKQYKQAVDLNTKLDKANPELETAIRLTKRYYDFLEELERLTGKKNNISLANGMFTSMKEVGKNLVTGFVNGIKSEYNELSSAIKSVLGDALSKSIASSYGYDFGRNLGDSIARGFKNTYFPKLKGTVDISRQNIVELQLKAYAAGGIVDSGQMFIAREAGAELVGNIGNRTSVMNNEQIVEAVADGVYRAVAAAMSENQGGNQDIYIDGRRVFEVIKEYNNSERVRTGANPLMG